MSHYNTRAPETRTITCPNVTSSENCFVEKRLFISHIGREINIAQTVVVHVADSSTAAVIKIAVTKKY